MNQRIWKYELIITDYQEIQMPAGAKVLSVANQGGALCMWAMVDTCGELETRRFEIAGTGNPMSPANRSFIGTVLIGPFVWHVFEIGKGKE